MCVIEAVFEKFCGWMRSPKRAALRVKIDADVEIFSHKNGGQPIVSAGFDHQWTYPFVAVLGVLCAFIFIFGMLCRMICFWRQPV